MRPRLRRLSYLTNVAVLVVSLAVATFAAERVPADAAQTPAWKPLPIDTGLPGLKQELRKLRTTARLMQVTAHPDDEDGGMLTMEARGRGVTVELFTFTRGEGGQNRMGSSLFDELGVLRTLELLASDRYYGVQQRFSHFADFGFSKSAEETFEKWGGRENALEELVREIRTFRPDVIVAKFSGTPSDGHGHHQASGMLAVEAFRAAADPKRFTAQIKAGLQPWQAQKVFTGLGGATTASVQMDRNVPDAVLGTTYQLLAFQGLRHQLSQGAGQWNAPSGPSITRYKEVDRIAELPTNAASPQTPEDDFFSGINTTLPGLLARLGDEQSKLSQLLPDLRRAESLIATAESNADSDRTAAAIALMDCGALMQRVAERVQSSTLTSARKAWLLQELDTKQEQLRRAAMLAAGLQIEAIFEDPSPAISAGIVVPGQKFRLDVATTHDPQVQVGLYETSLLLPAGWNSRLVGGDAKTDKVIFEVTVPTATEYTRPYYHRDDPARDSIYTIDEPRLQGLPLPPQPVTVRVRYKVGHASSEFSTSAMTRYKAEDKTEALRPIAVGPPVSVIVEPHMHVLPLSSEKPVEVRVRVRSNVPVVREGELRLSAPFGWRIEPATQPVNITGKGVERSYRFYLIRQDAGAGAFNARVGLLLNGIEYDQGFSIVSREDLATGYYYQPSIQNLSVVDVKTLDNMSVGYIEGAGDEIPGVLADLGINVRIIAPEELASGDLSRYSTIVTGIRAYDVREDVRKYNARLLDYVRNGGTLVVQYNADWSQFNSGKFTPYAADASRDRVSREDAPVKVLVPKNDEFDFPNVITDKDFEGWVQERGLYFMSDWDAGKFEPLIETHDPGEPERKGGLLKATYGKGTYIYCAYAFFRQLPNGVPGAIRFYVNLLSAPNEWKH